MKPFDPRTIAAGALSELLPASDGPGTAIADLTETVLDRLTELMTWAKARSELGEDADPRGLALAIHNLMIGISMQSKVVAGERELWRSASTTLKALGLYAHPERAGEGSTDPEQP